MKVEVSCEWRATQSPAAYTISSIFTIGVSSSSRTRRDSPGYRNDGRPLARIADGGMNLFSRGRKTGRSMLALDAAGRNRLLGGRNRWDRSAAGTLR